MQHSTGLKPFPRPIGPAVVAIPVKDEAERIEACVRALGAQRGATADTVVLVVNNTRDGSAQIARSLAPAVPFALEVIEHEFPPQIACAGRARRMAMERAAEIAGEGGVLLASDADGAVAPDWLARNLGHLARGAEAVCGRAVLDPADEARIPARLHDDDARECAYAAALDEIAARLDPEPWDPWPRHAERSGASLCVTAGAYRRAGGMPAAPLGEDRAFVAALRRVDARVRHATDVVVTVSGRVQGRAPGGMADTIRRRMERADDWLDDTLEPAATAVRRAWLRGRLRPVFGARNRASAEIASIARALAMPGAEVALALERPWFGEAWASLEAQSPVLVRRRVAVGDLPAQMARAVRERDALRVRDGALAGESGLCDEARA